VTSLPFPRRCRTSRGGKAGLYGGLRKCLSANPILFSFDNPLDRGLWNTKKNIISIPISSILTCQILKNNINGVVFVDIIV